MEGSDSAALAFPRHGRSKGPHPGGRHRASSQKAQSGESGQACASRAAFLRAYRAHPGGRHRASSQKAQSGESGQARASRAAFRGAYRAYPGGRHRASSRTAQSRNSGEACAGRPASHGGNGVRLGAVLGAALRARSGVRPRSGRGNGLRRAGNGRRPPLRSLGPAGGGLANSRPGPRGIPPAPESRRLSPLRPRSQPT